ncbi:MAG: hypothetical protein UW28_C0004G0030 [Parcubacteria group bacterium GW2011_GWA2_44_13]|nr:MAG: hypothetical protein UW28_C0004G0030 [Parcubacteria group bacterium GW2011_GWA2_44_13]
MAMKRYACNNIVAIITNLIFGTMWFFLLAIRHVAVIFTGKDIFNWKDDFVEDAPSDDEIFDIARRICPKCGIYAEDEAKEIGYHTGFNEKAFECERCGTIFLGTVRGVKFSIVKTVLSESNKRRDR